MLTLYQRNNDGGVINPPIIQSYEHAVHDAMQRCDFGAIIRLTAEYNAERDGIVRAEEGADSAGLGWSDKDMRGGLHEDATAQDIRPKFPEGGQPVMPAGMSDSQLAELQQTRAEMREMRALMAQLIQQGGMQGVPVDAPTPAVAPAKPLGATTVTAGPADKPTPSVQAAEQPLGYTGVTAGPADPPNPAGPVNVPLTPGGGNVPATGATDDTEGGAR